jgi:hypothetical protein
VENPGDFVRSLVEQGTSRRVQLQFELPHVGLLPGVVLTVSCEAGEHAPVDEFDAWLPCRHAGHAPLDACARPFGWPGEFEDMDMAWVAGALQAVYLARNPGLRPAAPARLRHCGAVVPPEARGEELLRQYQGGAEPSAALYAERIDLLSRPARKLPAPHTRPRPRPRRRARPSRRSRARLDVDAAGDAAGGAEGAEAAVEAVEAVLGEVVRSVALAF